MEIRTVIMGVLAIVVGAILLAAILPTALDTFYDVKSDDVANAYHGVDANGKTVADDKNITNNAATSAVFQLLPLFAVLGGMAILAGFAYKEYA